MGNLRSHGYDLLSIWHGERYQAEQDLLSTINPDDRLFYPCGECTRHYVHNRVLSHLHESYLADPEKFKTWAMAGPENPVVWI